MADQILIDTDRVIFTPMFGAATVVVKPGTLEGSGPATIKGKKVCVDGDETNLYDYENKVIRKLGEPRIHFALNCMVKDCPRLPQEPFDAEKLEEQLEQATLEFFGKDKHFYRKADRQEIWVSEILDFYTKDFASSGKAQDLVPYINRYVADNIPTDWRVKFIDYDWSINQQP